MKFNSLMPELYVSDFDRSLDFYVAILGFTLEYQRASPRFAFFSFHGAQLMLQELAPGEKEALGLEYPFGRGMNLEIDVPDVGAISNSLKGRGYPITGGARETWRDVGVAGLEYGSREVLVNDPDGYLLRFSQDLRTRRAP